MSTTDAVQAWFRAFPYTAAKAEMAELQVEMQKLSQRIYALQEAIGLYERHLPEEQRPAAETGKPDEPTESPRRPSLRKALVGIMAADPAREWTTDELRELLIGQSLLRSDLQGRNNLFATLSNLTKQGQLERPRKGWYRLGEVA